jgi:hypothetical protein
MTQPIIHDEKRAERIAAIRELADWLAANPDMPMPSYKLDVQVHLQNGYDGTETENLNRVRKLAASLGIETNERADDRTIMRVTFGRYADYEVFAWHKGGRDSELERLRAKVAELEAANARLDEQATGDPVGLTYSRVDDDPSVIRPHSPRVPLHTGAVVDGGELVGETPVTVHFSFGHGQTDPDTGKSLLDHYVTIVGPSYEACRAAMFASKYGNRWSFDYIAGTPLADEWVPQWIEHERIILPADTADTYVPAFGDPGCGKTVVGHADGCAEDAS